MSFSDLFLETFIALKSNAIRTALTVLGIVIGIGSVISMVAIGTGAQTSIQSRIQSIGSNLLMIRPGAQEGPGQHVSQGQGSAETLTVADAEAIRSISSVGAVAPTVAKNLQVVANGNNTRTSITGTTSEYVDVRNIMLSVGSFFSSEQNDRRAKVAILGPEVKEALFGTAEEMSDADVLGKKIRIDGIDFSVIGVTASKGGSGFGGSQDDIIYVPLLTTTQYFSGSETVSLINVTIANQNDMDVASSEITSLLLNRHGIENVEDADFRVMNQSDIVATATSVTGTFTVLLGAIAGISLLVGGIGIMNMMLTTVTERTREIGLRKAIGAKRRDISRQFLAESIALTFLGGFLGIVLGCGVAFLLPKFTQLTTEVSTNSIFLAFGVSAAIGILFGWYPARRAAALNPIDALRYE